MIEKKYASPDEMILKVRESKDQYEKSYLAMSFMEKLRVMVRLQRKAYLMGKLNVKPWPVDNAPRR